MPRGQAGPRESPGEYSTGLAAPLLLSLTQLKGRVGIFGGSFDPVHDGHLACARAARLLYGLDSVVFIPTPQNPLKDSAPQSGNAARLQMLVAALTGERDAFVWPAQLTGEVGRYSIDLVRAFNGEAPTVEPFLIVGSDCLNDLGRWREIHEVLRMAKLIVVERPGYEVAGVPTIDGLSRIECEAVVQNVIRGVANETSASKIRERLERGQVLDGLASERMAAIITSRSRGV